MIDIHLASDQVSQRAAHQNVAGKMVSSSCTGSADPSGQAIGKELGEWTWILVSNHRCHRPGEHGMVGRKRRIADRASKELSLPCAFVRTLSPGNQLEDFIDQIAVEESLAGKNAGFGLVVVSVPFS